MKIKRPFKKAPLDVETAQGRLIGTCLSLSGAEFDHYEPDARLCAIARTGVAADLSDSFSQHLLSMMSVEDERKRGAAAVLAVSVMEPDDVDAPLADNVVGLATLGSFAAWQIGDPLLALVLLGVVTKQHGYKSQAQIDLIQSIMVPGTAKQWRDWHAAHPEVPFGGVPRARR